MDDVNRGILAQVYGAGDIQVGRLVGRYPPPNYSALCNCSCADTCPLGRIGSEPRCTVGELAISCVL